MPIAYVHELLPGDNRAIWQPWKCLEFRPDTELMDMAVKLSSFFTSTSSINSI